MVELQVILDFACCHCEQSVGVTVKCAGKGLTAHTRAVASVPVPCPTCGQVNQLYFEPSGTVRDVVPGKAARRLEPSIN
jgi:phage FluMu protein Com